VVRTNAAFFDRAARERNNPRGPLTGYRFVTKRHKIVDEADMQVAINPRAATGTQVVPLADMLLARFARMSFVQVLDSMENWVASMPLSGTSGTGKEGITSNSSINMSFSAGKNGGGLMHSFNA